MFLALFVSWILVAAVLLWATISGALQLGSWPCALWLIGGAAILAVIRYGLRLLPLVLATVPLIVLWAGLSSLFLQQRTRVLTLEIKRAVSSYVGLRGPPGQRTATVPNVVIVVSDALRPDQ